MTISPQLSKILSRSFADARLARHEFFTPEHVLKAALDIMPVRDLLLVCGADVDSIRSNVSDYLEKQVPVLPAEQGKNQPAEPIETVGFQAIMNRAVYHCVSSDKSAVDITDVLVSMLDETKNYCAYYLRSGGLDRLHFLEVLGYIKNGPGSNLPANIESVYNEIAQQDDNSPEKTEKDFVPDYAQQKEPGAPDPQGPAAAQKKSALERYTVDLTKLAAEGKLDVLVGREAEIDRTIQILCRRIKNNPLHVGDAGVGKTAITEGLAARIAGGNVPDTLRGFSIYSLDMGSLIAGTKFRGDFEDRLHRITDELLKKKKAILFIDEIHTIVGAGATGSGAMDAANLLKPVLVSGEIRCIGSTTFEEYKKTFEKDRALSRRFQKIDVIEPSENETVKILKGLKPKYESYHGVRYSDEALKEAVGLSMQFLPDRRLPDKAIDIMDEAGSYLRIHSQGGFRGHRQKTGVSTETETYSRPVVTATLVRRITADIARVPVQTVTTGEKEKLRSLEGALGAQIFGQDKAVKAVTQAVKRARAGFRDRDKPEANFLFVGPTGVGKTELARCLAVVLGEKLLRFDMSEYQEKYTVSRLIGSPPGYVGFEEGGLLTDSVRKEPHAVILLDEIEKAHEDIYNVLLQVMDYGFLTDNQGRRADFRNCIIIMTSNAGARDMEKPEIGFGSGKEENDAASLREAVNKVFSPEFRNRLDAVIPFRHLEKDVVRSIVSKEIASLAARLTAKKVTLSVSDDCVGWLSDTGYSREFGARNIARTVDEKIAAPLVDEVLFGKLADGGTVQVSLSTVPDGEPRVCFIYG
jgi:ATP-dependent Clp protease ATP-binding subunit ClpA